MKKLLFITLSLCTILLCSAAPDNWDNRKDPIVGSIRLQKCNQTDVVVEVLGHLKEVGLTQTTLKAEILLQGRRPDGIYEEIGKRYVTLKQVTHGKDDNNIKRVWVSALQDQGMHLLHSALQQHRFVTPIEPLLY